MIDSAETKILFNHFNLGIGWAEKSRTIFSLKFNFLQNTFQSIFRLIVTEI